MPNRILREGILTSPRVAKLGWAEEVFYRRLMSVVDDFGRYYAEPGMLRAACYPRQLSKVSDSDIGKWTRTLAEAALVRVYPASDGERYLELLDFRQQVRAKESKFPSPQSACAADATQTSSNGAADAPVVVDVFVDVSGGVDDSARARAPRTPLTEPTEEHRSLAASLSVDCQAEFAKFRDWLAANGRRQRDEGAGFRNWLRRAAEFKPKGSRHDAIQAVNSEIWKGTTNGNDRDITAESERVA